MIDLSKLVRSVTLTDSTGRAIVLSTVGQLAGLGRLVQPPSLDLGLAWVACFPYIRGRS